MDRKRESKNYLSFPKVAYSSLTETISKVLTLSSNESDEQENPQFELKEMNTQVPLYETIYPVDQPPVPFKRTSSLVASFNDSVEHVIFKAARIRNDGTQEKCYLVSG